MFRRAALCLLVLPLTACMSSVDGQAVTGTPRQVATTPPPPPGAHAPGDCLAIRQDIAVVPCAEPHEYEVTRSDELPATVPDSFPPELDTVIGPSCQDALIDHTGSADVEASLVEAAYVWPRAPEWQAGQRWYSCLASVASDDGATAARTGSLRDALADGLGELRQCRVGSPTDPGPPVTVPCDRPHRSEAVTPVVRLGEPTEPPPSTAAVKDVIFGACRAAVEKYLGGERDGVGVGMGYGSPEQWAAGSTTGTCMAISDAPVTGLMGTP